MTTPVLRSSSPRNEESGQSGRSMSFMGGTGVLRKTMANYFSNHSQSHSRFLPSTSVSTPPQPPRSRPPASKHFSTSVSTTTSAQHSKDSSPNTPSPNSTVAVHPLRTTYVRTLYHTKSALCLQPLFRWVFWFRQQRSPGNKIISYEDGIKKISAFSSVRPLNNPAIPQLTSPSRLNHSGHCGPIWLRLQHCSPPQTTSCSTLASAAQCGKTLST